MAPDLLQAVNRGNAEVLFPRLAASPVLSPEPAGGGGFLAGVPRGFDVTACDKMGPPIGGGGVGVGYELQAVIANDEVLRGASRDLPTARVVSLGQGLSLMPITDQLFDAATDGTVGSLGFWRLPGGFDKRLADWSAAGVVAYVEAEYFGGVGEQHAAVWADGAVVLGPLLVAESQHFGSAGSPISQALRRLGVVAYAPTDEFATVGLDRHRHSEDWNA
ncbi:hypothetical protein ACFY13_27170 [Streptomyces mirabilis]|uniref:hypothetical protein n=1 Tax=Streptomyces TaxID=1883 RepID=UPI001967CD1F|nr:hypothetical protein [Streptomyces sp. S1A1-7]